MAQSVFPATTSDDWTLISSVTPTAGATTVSFTSISGYKKLLLRANAPQLATNGNCTLTFNSDSGANYDWASMGTDTTPIASSVVNLGATSIALGTGSANGPKLHLTIDEVSTANKKTLSGFVQLMYISGNPTRYIDIKGSYFVSAAITTVTLTASTTFAASGTVALYGVKL